MINIKKVADRMNKIKYKIAVISGKGGVGKSTVTVDLSTAFAKRGHANRVGILDADIRAQCAENHRSGWQKTENEAAGHIPRLG